MTSRAGILLAGGGVVLEGMNSRGCNGPLAVLGLAAKSCPMVYVLAFAQLWARWSTEL
jgi:hypothetical protein